VVRALSDWRIPFNRADLTGDELRFVSEAIANGNISGDGPFGRRCEQLLETALGVERVLLTSSCTHALELSALLLDIGPEDEVIVPAFTFVTTAAAFALRGARIVFADVRPDTLNIDEEALPDLVTDRTRAVVGVHYAGVAAELDPILALTRERDLVLVEDNAHGLFGAYRGRPLGTFGAVAAQSFHETKNFTCGEGGALLLNESSLVDRAEIIREKGTDRKRFFRGLVDKYTWVELGSSYVLSDLQAAFLAAQLEARETVQAARERVWQAYAAGLREWAERSGVRLPVVPAHCQQAFHMFYILLPSLDVRSRLIAHLRRNGILSVFHYLPLNLSAMGQRYGGRAGQCPVTEDVSDRLLRLPFYTSLSPEDQAEVIGEILAFDCG
jgi:dTDP-4-amino-4,6-dideoxygalactose transaminase